MTDHKDTTNEIVLLPKRQVVIECRTHGDGEAFMLAKRFEELGLIVHSVLNRTQTICGECSDETFNVIRSDLLVKSIQIDD